MKNEKGGYGKMKRGVYLNKVKNLILNFKRWVSGG